VHTPFRHLMPRQYMTSQSTGARKDEACRLALLRIQIPVVWVQIVWSR